MTLKAGEAYASYRISKMGELDIYYTYVPPALRGLGIGVALVKATADYALAEGHYLTASCPFAHRSLRHANWGVAFGRGLVPSSV